jgi:hypothetical protein
MRFYCFIIFILTTLISCNEHSDTKCSEIRIDAFTHNSDSTIEIYNYSNKQKIGNLKLKDESGWIVDVSEMNVDFLKVSFYDTNLVNIGIKKGDLWLNTQNYDGELIPLYSNPDTTSNVMNKLSGAQTVQVINVCKNWAYIKGKDSSKKTVEGWLAPNDQCSNPLTTCP